MFQVGDEGKVPEDLYGDIKVNSDVDKEIKTRVEMCIHDYGPNACVNETKVNAMGFVGGNLE